MPCNSDYLQASRNEIIVSQVECFFDELNGVEIDEDWRRGYHPRVYNCDVSKLSADRRVKALCKRLTPIFAAGKITDYSLELQLWWRDHKRADEARKADLLERRRSRALRKKGLSKLTPDERKALEIK
jgi:hypothetical protein